MRIPIHAAACVLCVLTTLAIGQPSDGDTAPGDASSGAPTVALPPVSAQQISERLASLGDANSTEAELLRGVLARLERAATFEARAAEAQRAAAEAPELLRSIREELVKPPVEPVPMLRTEPPTPATLSSSLAELEAGEALASQRLTASRTTLTELQAEAAKRVARRAQITEAVPRLEQRLAEVESALATPLSGDADSATANARLWSLQGERRELRAEISALDAEAANYEARRELLPARRDLEARRVSQAEKLAKLWEGLVAAKRLQQAREAAAAAAKQQREAALQHPVLQAYAAETQALVERRLLENSPSNMLTTTKRLNETTAATLKGLKDEYHAIRQRIDATGLSRATGLALRREFETLPKRDAIHRRLTKARGALEQVEYELIELDELREGSNDTGLVAQSLTDAISSNSEGQSGSTDGLIEAATTLAVARRDALEALHRDAMAYRDELWDLTENLEALESGALAYERYIKERILWVRSVPDGAGPSLADAEFAAGWYLDAQAWSETVRRTKADLLDRFPAPLFASSALILLFVVARSARRRLRVIADLVSRFRTDRLGLTPEALVMTLFVAAPVPALLLWLSWVLTRPPEQPAVGIATGHGLATAALVLFPLVLVRKLCRPAGVAAAHYRWPEASLRAVRRAIGLAMPVVLVSAPVMVAAESIGSESAEATLGRLAFTVSMLAASAVLGWLLRPKGPIVSALVKQDATGWSGKLRVVWVILGAGVPLALLTLAWMGYYYTAVQLLRRLEWTALLTVGLVLANGLLLRWLFIARRRVAVEDAKRRREQANEAAPVAGPGADRAPTQAIDEDKVDLPAISTQTKHLFRVAIWTAAAVGLFVVWADVMPALRILDRVELYPEPRLTSSFEEATIPELERTLGAEAGSPQSPARAEGGANGSVASPARTDSSDPMAGPVGMLPPSGAAQEADEADAIRITLADVALSLLILVVTYITFRNLPGLMEIMVLQRLPLDAGSRYALATVLRYAIVIVGMIAAFGAVKLSWSNVQWLAAALTFGLAFGLQEIFANFISGLIILAERPIRIGDTVTVGSVSGRVTRIRMRATTITDWELKELVIPNKSFITGDVINWTLSDPSLRVSIPVGVAYGTDTRRAEAVLLRCASEQPSVLREPAAYVYFNQFGDSTLNLELRVFLPHVDHLVPVKHGLHTRIAEAFKREGLEIAFPQRDLHIKSITGGGFPATPAGCDGLADRVPEDGAPSPTSGAKGHE